MKNRHKNPFYALKQHSRANLARKTFVFRDFSSILERADVA